VNERIAVMGAGVMGAGIVQVMAIAGHDVVGYDVSADVVGRARADVATGRFGVRGAVERGKLSAEQADAALARMTFTDDLDAVADADVVIEAVPERLDLKIEVFRDLDRRCQGSAILASNSSGFPIQALAAATDRPDRVIGWHWASPAPVMKMAEIVRGPKTSDATVAVVERLAAAAGKHPVVVKDTAMAWGYVANRVYSAMIREAQRVIDEGIADREQIDQLMIDCFRWPAGPFGMVRGAGSGWS
jgi:3-hydroxybutyryl-CoA dehydrogenase/3-hydroxyacyl-CoA dehydrogenase